MAGDYDASVICLRAIDIQARLLGLYPPPQSDTSIEKLKPKVTSTEDLRAASPLKLLRAEMWAYRPPPLLEQITGCAEPDYLNIRTATQVRSGIR
jgi:hypothetical protein